MVSPGHLSGGYLATLATVNLIPTGLSVSQQAIILVIGTLCGEAPDIDIAWSLFKHYIRKHKNSSDHRQYFTHGPLFWVIVGAMVIISGQLFSSIFTEYVGISVVVGTLTHFILDSIDYGVMWLWPFSRKKYSILPSNRSDEKCHDGKKTIGDYWHFITVEYPRSTSFRLESIITAVATITVILQVL